MLDFTQLEQKLYDLLLTAGKQFPPRWMRWLAMYYPDARIRRFFWRSTAVEMGEDTFANFGMIVSDDYSSGEVLLTIGNHVSIAPHVVFAPVSEPNNSALLKKHPYVAANLVERRKIVVEDDAWIGAHVTILPGVMIGRGAIIGAGAVVTENVAPFTIVAGVPARVIRTLSPPPHVDEPY